MIDWTRVAELRDEIGAEDFGDVVEIFLEEVEDTIDRLRRAGPDDYEAMLHFLKGSALNLGFTRFSGLCQTGEFLAAGGKATEIPVDEILEVYEASKQEFIGDLHRRFAA